MSNIVDFTSHRDSGTSTIYDYDSQIDEAIAELAAERGGILPQGDEVYAKIGNYRTRCFERLKDWQERRTKISRESNPYQLSAAALETLRLVMRRIDQENEAQISALKTQLELEMIYLREKVAKAHQQERHQYYHNLKLQESLSKAELELTAIEAKNGRLKRHIRKLQRIAHTLKHDAKLKSDRCVYMKDNYNGLCRLLEAERELYRVTIESCTQRYVTETRLRIFYERMVNEQRAQNTVLHKIKPS